MEPAYLVVGIGNELMTDDGVGVHLARLLGQTPPPRVTVIEVGTDFMSAVPTLEQHAKVLVIDAMDAGGPPGALYLCTAEAFAQSEPKTSLHELSLLSVLEFIRPELRPEIHFLGVQPSKIEYGTSLSPELQAALPRAAAAVHQVLASWQKDESG
jgi:hydrogenase maturation protease